MAFITEDTIVISFAMFDDVLARDQRVFDSNEGLTDEIVEMALIRATQRLLNKFRGTDWWRGYYLKRDTSASITSSADIPAMDPNRIKDRYNDFTDLCVYFALGEYILPQVADFGSDDDSEFSKMSYYANKADALFAELVRVGDWYDFDDNNIVESSEKEPGHYSLKRVR